MTKLFKNHALLVFLVVAFGLCAAFLVILYKDKKVTTPEIFYKNGVQYTKGSEKTVLPTLSDTGCMMRNHEGKCMIEESKKNQIGRRFMVE